MMFHRFLAVTTLLALMTTGCSTGKSGPSTFNIEPGQYAAVFDVTKETLREYGFALERVDARAGVITTKPRSSGGLVAPWDRVQSTAAQEWEDFLHHQERRVRISFGPASQTEPDDPRAQAARGPALLDLREFSGPMAAEVLVWIDRTHTPGRRIESTSLRLNTTSRDPALYKSKMLPNYKTPINRDDLLAGRLVRRIRGRVGE